jgi:hypothetical protein
VSGVLFGLFILLALPSSSLRTILLHASAPTEHTLKRTSHACRAIALFPDLAIMVTAQADGELVIFPLPAANNGAAGLGGQQVDVSCPVPGGGCL